MTSRLQRSTVSGIGSCPCQSKTGISHGSTAVSSTTSTPPKVTPRLARITAYQYPRRLRSGTFHENQTVSVHHGSADSGGWYMSSSGTRRHWSTPQRGPTSKRASSSVHERPDLGAEPF